MARSRSGGRRAASAASSEDPRSPRSAGGPAPAPSLASATLPRVWQGIGYRPLPDVSAARALFDFTAVPWPESATTWEFGWGGWQESTLVGAAVAERAGPALFVHGPVVVTEQDPLEVAAQLVAALLDHARALGIQTVFTRPHGLDRVWVRFGFIPRPENALPRALAGRPGGGLYAWRGGSALWHAESSDDNMGGLDGPPKPPSVRSASA